MELGGARWLTVAAVLASFFWMLGAAPLFDVDEGAFAQATLEMFQRGDFLSTYLNGEPRYDKPILVYWLQAASVALLGPTEWAFRLPSALCATAWAWLTYLFVRRHYGIERALFAAALLATSLGVYIIGRAATADALLNLLLAAAMFAAWLHLSTGERKWLYATHAAIGLGVLAKGPIVILLKEGRGFIDGFILKHNVGRFTGPVSGHTGSLLYYFPIVLILTLPFTALLVPLAQRVKTVWRDDLQLYLALWFAFVFVFFSLSGTKLPHYLLYGYTGLAILMAVHGADVKAVFWPMVPVLLFFLALLAMPYAITYSLGRIPDAFYREALGAVLERFDTFYFGFFAVICALVIFAMLERATTLPRKFAVFGLAAVAALSTLVVPAAGFAQQSALKEAALLARGLTYELLYSKRGIVLARIRA